MSTVNYPAAGGGQAGVRFQLDALGGQVVAGQQAEIDRVAALELPFEQFNLLSGRVRHLGVSPRFIDVVRTFDTPAGHTPPGFRVELTLKADGLLEADLVRDISYDADSIRRPTGVIFSADSANPYEVAPIAPLLGNLTCNPGIVYDLFINNPKANVGGKFTTRDEVMEELGRILGPGVDVSVELNNPFEPDFDKILEECEVFKRILSPYRLVVKVPHTGPVNADNVSQLLEGDKRFALPYDAPATADALRGHNLALKLRQHGYRINYTLMFEPYQTALALQAKPYFINSFVRHRGKQSAAIARLLGFYDLTGEREQLVELREVLLAGDYLPKGDREHDLLDVLRIGRDLVSYRRFDDPEGSDGLDGVRHNLRWLRQSNLPDTRLIICSMEGDYNYPDIDSLLADPTYADVVDRVIVTAEPAYLARFTSANQVVSYQRRFMNAAATAK
ncbi:MAG: transaldolase [Propionibacteriaceae bacterium]|jgi:hypothetical protein|nr:transaldolase [Propionibacteriaceae bacterium]